MIRKLFEDLIGSFDAQLVLLVLIMLLWSHSQRNVRTRMSTETYQ